MASIIYETFVVRVFQRNTRVPLGYVSSNVGDDLDIVKHNADGKLYDTYQEALEAALDISRANPEYEFDIQPVLLDTEDMYALCN
ncbi:MAG: hypothetical protein LIR46_06875 [Bacteroidota bacterium]|nr:hypothetical protein [Bacteroidota bacterium]